MVSHPAAGKLSPETIRVNDKHHSSLSTPSFLGQPSFILEVVLPLLFLCLVNSCKLMFTYDFRSCEITRDCMASIPTHSHFKTHDSESRGKEEADSTR